MILLVQGEPSRRVNAEIDSLRSPKHERHKTKGQCYSGNTGWKMQKLVTSLSKVFVVGHPNLRFFSH